MLHRRWRRSGLAGNPSRDLLARPGVIVVQVDDDGCKPELFCTALGGTLAKRLETIEHSIEISRRPHFVGIAGHVIHAVVGGAQRAGRVLTSEVVAESLLRPSFRTGTDV